MRARRGLVALVPVVLIGSLLASCSGIPTSGAVQKSTTTATAAPDPFIRVLAREPRAGATPTDIVGGFLAASASFDDDHAVARTYLTAGASQTWVPSVHVSVYDSEPGFTLDAVDADQVNMTAARPAGEISARGQFDQPTGTAPLRATFGMKKVNGEWRIAGVPKGLILSDSDVARAYRVINLYYLDVTGSVLVPDPVFLPTQQPGIATSITRELLRGPTAWLAPAVRSAFPSGTKLAVDAVPVQDGIARVDLEPRAVVANGLDRRAMAAQLTYTLTQLPDVNGVRITLSGVPFGIPGIGPVSRLSDWPGFDPNESPVDPSTYTIDRGHLSTVTTVTTPVPGFLGTTRTMTAAAVALDGRSSAAALTVGAGSSASSVVRYGTSGAAKVPIVYTGNDVTSLSFDRLGSVWFADAGSSTKPLWTARADRPAAPVRVAGLAGRSITSLKVSRDGVRIALVLTPAGGGAGQLLIGRVQRESAGPVVEALRRVEDVLVDVDDVAWADDSTLLVVGRRSGESVQSFTVGIDGLSVTSAGSVPSLRSVAACPGRPYLGGTTSDKLWIDRGTGWRIFLPGRVPVYPG